MCQQAQKFFLLNKVERGNRNTVQKEKNLLLLKSSLLSVDCVNAVGIFLKENSLLYGSIVKRYRYNKKGYFSRGKINSREQRGSNPRSLA